MRTANGDMLKAQELLGPMLAGQPLVSKYFTPTSPEIMEELADQPLF